MASPAADKDRPMHGCVGVFGARWGYTCVDVGRISGQRWPATWTMPPGGRRPARDAGLAQAVARLQTAACRRLELKAQPEQRRDRHRIRTRAAGGTGQSLRVGAIGTRGSHRSSVPAVSLRIASAVPPRRQRRGSGHFGGGRFLTGNIGRLRILGQTRGHLVGGVGKRRLSRQKVRFRSPQVIE